MNTTISRTALISLCFALATLIGSVGLCRSAPSVQAVPGYRGSIQTAYNQINASFTDNHLDRGCVFIENDYRQIDPQGHAMGKVSTRQKFQTERNMIRTIHTQCSITKMTVAADGVHVQMATHSSGTGVKRILFFDVKGTFVNDLRVDDVWVNTAAGWRLKSRLMLQDDSRLHKS